jgi:hypothetical protein
MTQKYLRILFPVLIFFVFADKLRAQDTFEKVNKQYSPETGFQYNFKTSFDSLSNQGYSLLLDYAWQLSGYNGKPAAYISVPLGYTHFHSTVDGQKSFSILNYGWTVRHEIKKEGKFIPFLGYGLLLNQLRISNTEGSIFGHQTKFEFGVNYSLSKRMILFLKAEYSYRRFPTLGTKESQKMQSSELKFGMRF